MEKEELLDYAREHYPIGTVADNSNLDINHMFDTTLTIKNKEYRYVPSIDGILVTDGSGKSRTIYKRGVWATILNSASKESYSIY